jgi:hypothetical protein
MARVLVGYPFLKPHKQGLPHLIQFYGECAKSHAMFLEMPMWRPLHKAQNTIVEAARHWRCEYILFVEDDQWGFPVDGLDLLLSYGKDVVGLPTYKKEYPFLPINGRRVTSGDSLLEKNGLNSFFGTGVETVDLISFGFTLVRTDVFDRIKNPFELPYADNPADSYFSQYCDDAGIEKWVDFSFIINHGDLSAKEVPYRRQMEEMMAGGIEPGRTGIPPLPEETRKDLQSASMAQE